MKAPDHRLTWYFVLLSGISLGIIPIFMDLQVFNPVMIAAALVLMMSALIGLRRPKRIRLPRRRTFS
jgi:hypothetical protein